MRLNLGCSDALLGGDWTNVDIVPPCDQVADLSLPWPWADSSVEEIRAFDIFEHIGDDHTPCHPLALKSRHWSGRIHVMNEAHRVLIPGGRLVMECPDAAMGCGHFQDPQHVSPWTPNALQYYEYGAPARVRFGVAYGITAEFKVLNVTRHHYTERGEVWKFCATLEAVK